MLCKGRLFGAITYLFAAEPAMGAACSERSRGRSMLQGAPAPRTRWWKEVTGRRITMGHLYTIYMQDKLIHDRQPGRSRGTLQAGERHARLGCASSSPLRPSCRGFRSWIGVLMPSCAVLWHSSHGRVVPGCLLTAIGNVLPSHSSPRGILDEMDTSAFGL